MQLQCLEVPRSVEICLKSMRRPKTQIHFPNPAMTRMELTSQSAISACCRTLSDSKPHNRQGNSTAPNVKCQQSSDEDALHYRTGQRLDASAPRNHTSHEGRREQTLPSRISTLGKELVYQSACEISLSEVNAKPRWPSAARRATRNKPQSRKNCWGGTSYTDLITTAIVSSPHKRMTLAQIYDWIVKNVPYFKDKECYLSVQGWKNTVRHTLSIRRRFVRIMDPKRPYRSMWTVGEEEGSRRVTQAATKRLNKARTGSDEKPLNTYIQASF